MWIHRYFNVDRDAREQEEHPRDDIIGPLLTAEVDGIACRGMRCSTSSAC